MQGMAERLETWWKPAKNALSPTRTGSGGWFWEVGLLLSRGTLRLLPDTGLWRTLALLPRVQWELL